jgi:hypothetical protein
MTTITMWRRQEIKIDKRKEDYSLSRCITPIDYSNDPLESQEQTNILAKILCFFA